MRRLSFSFAVLLALFAAPALAHPHIFVDAKVRVIFNANGEVTGIHHEWTFDEAMSAWQIQGLDADNDGTVTRAEMQELADENMVGLSQYYFYTFAGEGDESLNFVNGTNASFDYQDGRTTLVFDIAVETPYRIKDTLELAVNDPEYYVAITTPDLNAVTLDGAPERCVASLQPPRELDPAVAERLYALGPDVTELPADLANAMRGVQGAILIKCPGGAPPVADTALEAVTAVADSKPVPFGGPPREPGVAMPQGGLFGWINTQQKDFYAALTAALGRLKDDGTAFWLLGSLSFAYGVFHAAGPGHGKVVISSYVLANERQLRRGVLLSFAAALMQSLVAVVFILIAGTLLNLTSVAMSDAANWIGIGSYLLVTLLGIWLIARKLFGLGHAHHGHHHHHDHGHDHHDHAHHDHAHIVPAAVATAGWREQLGVVLAVGLRPCSGALVVLVFALSQGVLAAGIAAVFLMGLGTAITVAVLASVAVFAKDLALRAGGRGGRLASALVWWFELAGALAVFGFGVLLLIASF